MNWDFDSILEQSITQIAAGKARLESCLLAYPTLAGELEPLLRAAASLQETPKPVLSPVATARIEVQVLSAAAANPLLRPPARRWMPVALPSWRWAFNALTVAVLIVFLLMATLATASADALPGSTLYPVKLATEDAWLWVTPARSEPALHLRFARRRLAEVKELAKQGILDRSVLEAMTGHVDAALEGLDDLPPAIALPLLDEAAGFIEEQQVSLSSIGDVLPQDSRAVIESVLDWSREQTDRVHALVRALRSRESEAPVATLEPVAPLAVTITPTLTQSVEPTLTQPVVPTLIQSVEPTLMPTMEPTGTLAATPALEPTAGSQSVAPTKPPTSPPPESTQPPPTQPPPTQPPPTQPPPTQPPATQPPPEPTATKRVPPGRTNTPQPPGLTKTPKP